MLKSVGDLSDSCSNSDNGQVSGNDGGDDEDNNELVINHLKADKCLFLWTNFLFYILVQICLKK
jgi:hypothetical protein